MLKLASPKTKKSIRIPFLCNFDIFPTYWCSKTALGLSTYPKSFRLGDLLVVFSRIPCRLEECRFKSRLLVNFINKIFESRNAYL